MDLQSLRFGTAAIVAAAIALAASTGVAGAEEDHGGVAQVVIRADLLNVSIGGDGAGPTVGEWLKELTIFADGRECGVLPLLKQDGSNLDADAEFSLGLDGQPSVCSTAGARLSYVDTEGRILFLKHYLSLGATHEITNFGPEPPVDPSPYPQVLIPARVLDTPEANAVELLAVLAGNQKCGEISLTDESIRNDDGDIVFQTHPYGGNTCGDPFADELRFADSEGRLLAQRFMFDLRKPMVLFDFALAPIPGPPNAGSGRTPDSGEGGAETATALLAFTTIAIGIGFIWRLRAI